MASLQDSKTNFERCLTLLKGSATKDFNDTTILAGFLKHFELTFETAWKVLRAALIETHGVNTTSPRTAIENAFAQKLIQNETKWLEMIKDRNLSVHVYSATDARQLADRVKRDYISLFEPLMKI